MASLRQQLGASKQRSALQLSEARTVIGLARLRSGPSQPLPSPNNSKALSRGKCSTLARFKGVLPLSSAALLPGARNVEPAG